MQAKLKALVQDQTWVHFKKSDFSEFPISGDWDNENQ